MDPCQIAADSRRLEFDDELRKIQEEVNGYHHTYFEPTESVRMKYDAVVYKRNDMNVRRADNKSYLIRDSYLLTVISRNPETFLPRAIQDHFERCAPGRFFVRDNLYHFPFTIFY